MEGSRKSVRTVNIAIGIAIALVFMVMIFSATGMVKDGIGNKLNFDEDFLSGVESSGSKIGVLYVTGVIHSGRSGGFMGDAGAGSDTLVRSIQRAERRPDIKALVVRVDSPGGSAAASQEIYNALLTMKKNSKKPVIVSMGDVAASGGYYVACAGDTVFASRATLTGSIGVIMNMLNYQELFDKLGLKSVTLKSGPHKDIGSPYRPMSEQEKKILQSAIDSTYEQFVDDVKKGRGKALEKKGTDLKKIADGSIFTGEQALALGLIDKTGGLQEAIKFAAEEAGIKGNPSIDYLQKEYTFPMLFDSMSNIGSKFMKEKAFQEIVESMLLSPALNER